MSGSHGVDWRRTMFYVPGATTIQVTEDRTFGFVGHQGTFASVAGAEPISSPCGLLWIGGDARAVISTSERQELPEVGSLFLPGSGTVSAGALHWNAAP